MSLIIYSKYKDIIYIVQVPLETTMPITYSLPPIQKANLQITTNEGLYKTMHYETQIHRSHLN